MTVQWLTLFLDLPANGDEAFWFRVTGATPSPRRGPDGAFVTLLPDRGDAYVRIQRVRAGAGGCHLDLHVDDLLDAADRAVSLGARERFRDIDDGLVVFDSPGGFPFCLVRHDGEATVPPPCADGGPNRLDQLCLDVPPPLFDAECAFWAELAGWPLRPGSRPEFRYLERPAGIPVRLLFQRTDSDGGRVGGHADFACADRAALTAAHVAAGASVAATFPRWTVLADPAGRPYCLTDRDPHAS